MGHLYIVRHGQTLWNLQGRIQGRRDSPLTDLGEIQARRLAKWLGEISFSAVFTSSAPRAVATAEILGEGRNWEIIPMDSLQEAAFGPWEGQTKEFIKDRWEKEFQLYWEDPAQLVPLEGMESFPSLEARCRQALEHILRGRRGESILVVTHGVTSAMLLAILQEKPWSEIFTQAFKTQTSVSLVDFSVRPAQVVYRGRTDHLN